MMLNCSAVSSEVLLRGLNSASSRFTPWPVVTSRPGNEKFGARWPPL